MAAKKKKKNTDPNFKIVADNRKARYHYAVEDDIECGIVLVGSEVKSLREGKTSIAESYATVENGELWLVNAYIPAYGQAKSFPHEEKRRRKLLVSKRQLSNLWKNIGREGLTLVPLRMYFNEKGRAKLKLGIAKGKKMQDKRETEKRRDWGRQKARLLRDRG